MKRTMVGAMALAAAFAVVVPSAHAAKEKTKLGFDAIVYFEKTNDAVYIGPIESDKKACANKRKVTVYFKKSGKDKKIGSNRSQAGKMDTYFWEISKEKEPKSGTYYAKTPATDDCKGDKSPDYDYLSG